MGVTSHPSSRPISMALTTISGLYCSGVLLFGVTIRCQLSSVEDGHVIPGLINKCYMAKQNGTFLNQ